MIGSLELSPMICIIELSPKVHFNDVELGRWESKIKEWMQENLDGEWECDWEFGAEGPLNEKTFGVKPDNPATPIIPIRLQPAGPDFYLRIVFSMEEDKVKFILKWG